MPPKKAGGGDGAVSPKNPFFLPGGFKEAFAGSKPQSKNNQPPAAKKQKKTAAPPPPAPPPKNSFFSKPGDPSSSRAATPTPQKKPNLPPPFPQKSSFSNNSHFPRRSFLYDKFTEEPYAEWIGNEAVCLETGEVLFESKRRGGEWGDDDDDDDLAFSGGHSAPPKYDFTPPAHKHPKDPSISSQDLIDKGILSLDDFLTGNAGLSVEAYRKYMETLLLLSA